MLCSSMNVLAVASMYFRGMNITVCELKIIVIFFKTANDLPDQWFSTWGSRLLGNRMILLQGSHIRYIVYQIFIL